MAGFIADEHDEVMSEINMVPFIDVMLVLLIIFIITAQLTSHTVKIELPTANPATKPVQPDVPPIDVAIKYNGSPSDYALFMDDQPVSNPLFKQKMAVAATQKPQPQINIRADKALDYGVIRKLVDEAKSEGIVHVGFVTKGDASAGE